MAEKLSNQNSEQKAVSPEIEADAAEQSRKNIERIKALAEQEKGLDEKAVESLREEIETAAETTEDVTVETQEKKPHAQFDQGSLKRATYKKTMKKVQSQLPPAERVLSKVIHQKTVETISNFSGKTIARPSGILGGGLIALIGSLFVLYFAKHYGFEYNYTLFILLYALGFGIGLLLEVGVKLTNRKN